MSSLRGTLFLTLKRVSDGELEPSVGNSMATIARAIVAVSQATDLEERLTPDILPLRYFLLHTRSGRPGPRSVPGRCAGAILIEARWYRDCEQSGEAKAWARLGSRTEAAQHFRGMLP